MFIFRTLIKKEIVAEFLPPAKPSRKVLILCVGLPSYPGRRDELMEFFARKGYWVFLPRYRGTWESRGTFLKKSPHLDILDVIDVLPKGFKDLWSKKTYKIKNPKVYIFGSSFGCPAAIFCSRDKRVEKIVALSPVIDWRVKSKVEPMDWLGVFIKCGFGGAYVFKDKDWARLSKGKFYNPISEIDTFDSKKICIVHAKDDKVVSFKPTEKFAAKLNCKFIPLKKGGHLSFSIIMEPKFWKQIRNFLK
ncbi:MAG: prolyl oligopeptidase family serine peptidase [Candidatus Pacebacteria bacterium]|nr:prolyl oligopeptidase family serine peptidase [Candidatus Paceibacterota bacterium]